MAPTKKTRLASWRGPQPESYVRITWSAGNRAKHETQYPDRPRFTAIEFADWSRVLKRVDIEHAKPGKNSFQALVGRPFVGADLVTVRSSTSWPILRRMASSNSSASGSPTPRSGQSSSSKPAGRRDPAAAAMRGPLKTQDQPQPTLDRDALDALAWIASGMPDSRVGYGPDAPELTPEQFAEFKPATYVLGGMAGPEIAEPKRAIRRR